MKNKKVEEIEDLIDICYKDKKNTRYKSYQRQFNNIKYECGMNFTKREIFYFLQNHIEGIEKLEEDNVNKIPDFISKKEKIIFEVKGGFIPNKELNNISNSLILDKVLKECCKKNIKRDYFYICAFYINIIEYIITPYTLREILYSNFFNRAKIDGIFFFFQRASIDGGREKVPEDFFIFKNEKLEKIFQSKKVNYLFLRSEYFTSF